MTSAPDDILQLDPETMRQVGYRVVDMIVEHFSTLRQVPLGRRGERAELARRLQEPIPQQGTPIGQVLEQFQRDVLSHLIHVDHPRYFAFIGSPSNFVGAMADALAAGFNVFAGTWMVGSGAAQVELVVIDWLRQLVGFPKSGGGLFVSGGSMANLIALATARHIHLGDDFQQATVYFSDQTHSAVERGLKVLGFRQERLRRLPSDENFRLPLNTLQEQIAADRRAGLKPFCVVANVGTTNTGAIDPLPELAPLCRAEGLWLHADGAYGAAAVLCEKGKQLLRGIEQLDSLAIDPHKWLYQPHECGCVLVRDFRWLKDTFRILPDYLRDKERAAEEVDFCDYGIQLSRAFRALKVWMSFKTFGLEAFRRAVERTLSLGEYAETCLRQLPHWEVVAPATLGIVAFRCAPPSLSPEAADQLNRRLVEAMIEDGFAMVSSTLLRGRVALRMCTINPRATEEDIHQTVQRLHQTSHRLLMSSA